MSNNKTSLELQIIEKSQEISTDSYSMSVGELISMYRDEELNIHPAFQRLFRWTNEQKSKFIESILLGIPIPSIFVAQNDDGTWEIVDGLQRLSTIFQLVGVLQNVEGERCEPLILSRTQYLPSLKDKHWGDLSEKEDENVLPSSTRLEIKRSRLDVNIVLKKSDAAAKYELFQRLNTGGSQATDQEIRNCMLVMMNRDFFEWFSDLGSFEPFRECIPLTDRALDEQYHLELVTRFLVFRQIEDAQLKDLTELGTFLTAQIISMAQSEFDYAEADRAFKQTFGALAQALGESVFKKYYPEKRKAQGPMLISNFEVLGIGLGYYSGQEGYEPDIEQIENVHNTLWDAHKEFATATGSGIRASTRIPVTVCLGRELFGD